MPGTKLTKRVVDAAETRSERYTLFDALVPGFGLRIYPTGQKSWIFEYRAGEGGRATAKKRATIGKVGDFTPDQARKEAERLHALVKTGSDPQGQKVAHRQAPTVADLVAIFLEDHVKAKRKAGTYEQYRDILNRLVVPAIGSMEAKNVKRADVARLHLAHRETPYIANRMLAVLSSMYGHAGGHGLVPEEMNPARGVERFPEHERERLLSPEELERLGAAIREAETVGIPWDVDPVKSGKHLQKSGRVSRISPHTAAALRLLLFSGARLREILTLRWEEVDLQRGLLFLPDSKTGKKPIVLSAPALEVLSSIERVGVYVIAGDTAGQEDEKPRADLKKPWALVTKRAGLEGLRIHDLRHNFASAQAVAWGFQSSASCSGTAKSRPPHGMLISTPTRCAGRPTP